MFVVRGVLVGGGGEGAMDGFDYFDVRYKIRIIVKLFYLDFN